MGAGYLEDRFPLGIMSLPWQRGREAILPRSAWNPKNHNLKNSIWDMDPSFWGLAVFIWEAKEPRNPFPGTSTRLGGGVSDPARLGVAGLHVLRDEVSAKWASRSRGRTPLPPKCCVFLVLVDVGRGATT